MLATLLACSMCRKCAQFLRCECAFGRKNNDGFDEKKKKETNDVISKRHLRIKLCSSACCGGRNYDDDDDVEGNYDHKQVKKEQQQEQTVKHVSIIQPPSALCAAVVKLRENVSERLQTEMQPVPFQQRV